MPLEAVRVGAAHADDELEAEIERLGSLMRQAYAQGNRQAAEQYLQAQTLSIRGRSPERVHAMEAMRGLGPGQCAMHGAGCALPKVTA